MCGSCLLPCTCPLVCSTIDTKATSWLASELLVFLESLVASVTKGSKAGRACALMSVGIARHLRGNVVGAVAWTNYTDSMNAVGSTFHLSPYQSAEEQEIHFEFWTDVRQCSAPWWTSVMPLLLRDPA